MPGSMSHGAIATSPASPAESLPHTLLQNSEYKGERPLFALTHARLEQVRFLPGESALKHSRDIQVQHCEFDCRYPLWHSTEVQILDCRFEADVRAAVWYSNDVVMRNCLVHAPKMFRRVSGLWLQDCRFTDAAETMWNCDTLTPIRAEVKGADYLGMNSSE